jgi:uncharacterized protein (TIGR03437 family)
MRRINFIISTFFVLLASASGQTLSQPSIDHIITASGFGGYAALAAPASYVEIYGSNLAGSTRTWAASDFTGPAAPTSLDGVSVTVNGTPAYISYIAPTQINMELPDNLPTGPVPVIVSYQGRQSVAVNLTINSLQPGLLAPSTFNVNGKQYVVPVHASGGAVATSAQAGETLVFYGIGFGPVTQGAVAGRIAASAASLVNPFTMTIGNSPATVRYAGIAPGNVGLYQFNVDVPAGLSPGDQQVQITLNGSANALQTLYLTIAAPTAPGPPTALTATAGNASATIGFTAPASNGGSAITKYTASCSAGNATFTGAAAASPIVVTGLTNGTTYTCTVTATNSAGTSAASASVSVIPAASATNGSFTLTSTAGANGGVMAADYTCDGTGSTIPLAWSGAPSGTKEFALLMTTLPGDGTTKWNWVLYHIPATVASLAKDSFLVGTTGVGSDGGGAVYDPPCSQGPGLKLYTYTLYALAGAPVFSVPAAQVTGQNVTDAIASLTLASASLTLGFSRTTNTGSSTACGYIGNSLKASKSGTATVACDGTYGYISSLGTTTAQKMNGITSTNLQVPTAQNFQGAYGWKIPLNPAIAPSPTSVVDGPLGVAINGVPIFNPCTQGGCVTGGDTKVLGQLDSCNGHSGRADDYHYHAAPTCMMADQPASYWDTHPLGWALDGFAIFGYHDADGTTAARDAICGGNTKANSNAPAGYSYHVTDASPYVTSCLIGTPSPDLAGQGAKYHPLRQPPVTPFNNTAMTLTTDATDGYQVLQFTSAIPFTTTETGTDSYANKAGTYKIRYAQVTGGALASLLALKQNAGATACWNFQFVDSSGNTTQPTVSYCR